MTTALLSFVRERFPFGVSVPLAFAVAGGARPDSGWHQLITSGVACWCFLLAARAHDDLADLEHDRLHKPERGLARGSIDARALRCAAFVVWLVGMAAALRGSRESGVALLAATFVYLSYYVVRQRLAPALRPLWLNAPYLALTLLSPLALGVVSAGDVCLALFVWLAVVGQDFAHSVETDAELYQPSGLSARMHGWLGGAFCAAALLTALGFELLAADPIFGAVLALITPWPLVLLVQLVRKPSRTRARGLYVPGGLFFILPLLSRLGGGLFRR